MSQIEKKEVIPSAKKLIKSLRNIGYDFATAVADLVDNSLEANATKVDIDVEFAGEESFIRIADNGKGMNITDLQEAMRLGSNHDYEKEEDLGKFGLGLKTASFSQCKSFIVASRSERYEKNINAYCWDLDEVEISDKWEITKIDPKTLNQLLDRHLTNSPGTVVIWRKLDRILGLKRPDSDTAKNRLAGMCRELEDHLGMVFHRYLSREVPGRNLRILINDKQVVAWDPYCRSEVHTQKFDSIKLDFENEGKVGSITLQPYILPAKFSSNEAFALASGPKKWNRQQGFYIYRADRMIQCGGWAGIRTIDEHLKLARISLDFSSFLDEYFNLNISKMQVKLPPEVRKKIDAGLSQVVKQANRTYRKKDNSPPIPPIAPRPILPGIDDALPPIPTVIKLSQKKWSLDDLKTYLLYFAKPDEIEIVERLFTEVIRELEGKQHGS